MKLLHNINIARKNNKNSMNESLTRSQVFFQIDFFFHAAYIMHNMYMHKPRMTTRRTSFNREFLRNTPHKDFIAPYILCPRSVRFSNAFRRTRAKWSNPRTIQTRKKKHTSYFFTLQKLQIFNDQCGCRSANRKFTTIDFALYSYEIQTMHISRIRFWFTERAYYTRRIKREINSPMEPSKLPIL